MINIEQKLKNPLFCIQAAYYGIAIFMLIAIIIRPEGLTANHGFSYYSGFLDSGIPAVLGYFWMSFFLYNASKALAREKVPGLRYLVNSLKVMALLVVCIAVTPHNIFVQTHKVFGSGLFILQLWLTIVFARQSRSRWYRLVLVAVELISGIISAFYVPKEQGYLLHAQLVFQFAFALVLIDVLKYQRNLTHKKRFSL